MSQQPSYMEIIEKNRSENTAWSQYYRGEAPLPEESFIGQLAASYLFYLGLEEKAKEVCEMVANSLEKKYKDSSLWFNIFSSGFHTALYYDLAGKDSKAKSIWKEIEVGISQIEPEEILQKKKGNLWVYRSYALTKLGYFDEAREPAMKGREAIEKGKGTSKAPHRNSREYALAPLLIKLAEYKLDTYETKRESVQEQLLNYKKENVRYGRLGYPVIFDLQFSYPDLFDPVLPGPDPSKD